MSCKFHNMHLTNFRCAYWLWVQTQKTPAPFFKWRCCCLLVKSPMRVRFVSMHLFNSQHKISTKLVANCRSRRGVIACECVEIERYNITTSPSCNCELRRTCESGFEKARKALEWKNLIAICSPSRRRGEDAHYICMKS